MEQGFSVIIEEEYSLRCTSAQKWNEIIWDRNLLHYWHFEIIIDAHNSSCSTSDEEREKKEKFHLLEFGGVEAL